MLSEASENKIAAIIKLLGQEKDIYMQTLELSRQLKEHIMKNAIQEVENCSTEQGELLDKAYRIGDEREKLSKELAMELPDEEVNITLLSKYAKPNQRVELLKLQKQLLDIVKEQNEINQLNRRLMTDQLDFVEFMMESIVVGQRIDNNYKQDGQAQDLNGFGASLFDHKA